MENFHVIKFLKGNRVTVVPVSWVRKENGQEVCAWPPYKSQKRLEEAVEGQELPGSSWELFKVSIMKSTESYERALYYEDKALFVSDLTTETEGTEETMKRKKKKRKKSDYFSSSDEETNLPPFPKLKKKASDLNESQPKSFVAEPFYIIPEAQAVTPSQSASSSHFFTPTDMLQHHAQNASSFNIQTISTYPASTSSDLLNQSFVQGASPLTSVENKNTKEESFQRKMIRMMEAIRQDIKEIKQSLKFNRNPLPVLPSGIPKFPCDTPEDLMDLENILQDGSIFSSICDYLSTIGGNGVNDTTRRVLQQLISNSLSMNYNWKGTRGVKLGFSTFTLIVKLILGAVRNNPSSSQATEKEVEDHIKKWLMHAKDRDGGRNIRGKKNEI